MEDFPGLELRSRTGSPRTSFVSKMGLWSNTGMCCRTKPPMKNQKVVPLCLGTNSEQYNLSCLTSMTPNFLRRLPDYPDKRTPHTLTVRKSRFARHCVKRMATGFDHYSSGFNPQMLDSLSGRFSSFQSKCTAKLT